jgi:hypothetical protein
MNDSPINETHHWPEVIHSLERIQYYCSRPSTSVHYFVFDPPIDNERKRFGRNKALLLQIWLLLDLGGARQQLQCQQRPLAASGNKTPATQRTI